MYNKNFYRLKSARNAHQSNATLGFIHCDQVTGDSYEHSGWLSMLLASSKTKFNRCLIVLLGSKWTVGLGNMADTSSNCWTESCYRLPDFSSTAATSHRILAASGFKGSSSVSWEIWDLQFAKKMNWLNKSVNVLQWKMLNSYNSIMF